jgi:tetratricopeptide (TPR) repeat protein
LSPLFFGGFAGMAAFAVSSLVSSFSFRAFQIGIIFFLALVMTLSATLPRKKDRSSGTFQFLDPRWLNTAVYAIPALLLIFSLTKAVSQYMLLGGERSKDLETAVRYFDAALVLDPDNPGAELAAAQAYVREKRWEDAVPHFRRVIDRGFGVTVVYSYMANAQEMSGKLDSAEASLREAAAIFPRSTFIRARLAIVLEKNGNNRDAEEQVSIGRSIDPKQTNGWHAVIKDGILDAHLKAQSEPDKYAAPPALRPYNAIYAYNTDKVRVD